MKSANGLIFFLPLLLLMGCGANPEPIAFGKDHCSYCKMNIADPKFGAELVTTKGKIFKFDALECMVPFMEEQPEAEYAFTLGIAYDNPEKLVSVDSLQFIISDEYNSPMGANLAGFRQVRSPGGDHETHDWHSLKQHLSKSR